jgi:peptide-methionine (S)-S-oxide reductase
VAHDPTQLDRQGNDQGRQYRSAIFYRDEEQRAIAEAYIRQLDAARVLPQRIATRLEPLGPFYIAEDYHQDYAARNPDQPYIVYVSTPKVERTRRYFCSLK